jgi:CRP/FNR family nitrogen fixation transcriptional regulator
LTLETVSRTVSQFNDEGVLALAGARHIRLRDRTRLAAMDA